MLEQFISQKSSLRVTGVGRAGFSMNSTGLKATHNPSDPTRKLVIVLENADGGVNDGEVSITPNITGGSMAVSLYFNRRQGVLFEFDFGQQVQLSVASTASNTGNVYYTVYEFERD